MTLSGMPVIGREWHEDDPLALAIHDALVMQSKSLGNTLQTARTAKIAAEAARQQHAGAVDVLEKIREQAGAVCDEYEVCEHRACQASYTAWALADAYLHRGQ
ncbi:hypothetical protein [Candidatus Solirubrobacter pratensis]|uniref:hypothetical protein n=1 Tax=Candidatus Solirubrobacter pratensis TaxID=1298857 RepID=UPI000480F977|nr:hypothetical protein [Candidatus Solirubrobacter pratensis]